MGRKRTRNHYPRLPDAVQNLLILHGLRAVPMKERSFARGASLGWYFSVVPDKPGPKVTVQGQEFLGGWSPLFKLRASDSLNTWIENVQAYADGRIRKASFNFDLETWPEWP